MLKCVYDSPLRRLSWWLNSRHFSLPYVGVSGLVRLGCDGYDDVRKRG
jgi:hypothetical protein